MNRIHAPQKLVIPFGGHAALYPYHSGGLAVYQGCDADVDAPHSLKGLSPSRNNGGAYLCSVDDGGIQSGG